MCCGERDGFRSNLHTTIWVTHWIVIQSASLGCNEGLRLRHRPPLHRVRSYRCRGHIVLLAETPCGSVRLQNLHCSGAVRKRRSERFVQTGNDGRTSGARGGTGPASQPETRETETFHLGLRESSFRFRSLWPKRWSQVYALLFLWRHFITIYQKFMLVKIIVFH